ncbi:MAG: ATP-binding cassette domain-containing protein [Microthrixaceae bacterium]
MPPAIQTDNIKRTFDGKPAVDGVDLDVPEGEIYGFLGPNGAGKSTMVRMLCTLLRPTSGSARVLGHDVVTHPDAVRFSIGVALQDAGLDERQTGREILDIQGRLYGLNRTEIDRRINDIIAFIDLGDAFDQRVGTYSGGMKRRLDLAASLVHNPKLLFLDEPTTGLDPISRKKVWAEVRHLNEELGMTVFLTTQYLEEADELADRVGIISHGKLAVEDTPSALKRQLGNDLIVVEVDGEVEAACTALRAVEGAESVESRGHELLVGAPDGAALLSPVAISLGDASVKVRSLTLRTPTLDDVFVSVTGERLAGDEEADENSAAVADPGHADEEATHP